MHRAISLILLVFSAALPACGDGAEEPDVRPQCERHCKEQVPCQRERVGDVGDNPEADCVRDCVSHPDQYQLDVRGCEDLRGCDYIDCLR